jgi:acetyl-CoA carboxylase alpha subunit
MRLGSRDLLRLGVCDGIVREPAGGAGSEPHAAASRLGDALAVLLEELVDLPPSALIDARRERFRRFGWS